MSAGTAPSMLSRRALVAAFRLFADAKFNEFPITQLFGAPRAYDESTFVIDIIEELRTLGTEWRSGPAPADPVELDKWSRLIVSALFISKKWDIPAGFLNETRDVDAGETDLNNGSGNTLDARKREIIARKTESLFRYVMRQYEMLAINTLTQTSFSVTVDGVAQTINFWNLQKDTASTSWATNTTKIAADWAHVVEAAEKQFGGPIAKVIIPNTFYKDYLVGNDEWAEFVKFNPEFIEKGFGPDFRMAKESATYEVIKVRTQSGSSASPTPMWPSDCVVLLGPDYERALRNCTVRTKDNDYNGGLYSYVYETENPKGDTLIAGNNGIPAIIDWSQVYCYDVTP